MVTEQILPQGNAALSETAYRKYAKFLGAIAISIFRVPAEDVESLVHDVFVSYQISATEVYDTRKWLVGAICNASRSYWRKKRRADHTPLDEASAFSDSQILTADRLAIVFTVQKALGYLEVQCREALRMHYFEGRTAREIAVILLTTPGYAERIIHICLTRVREVMEKLERQS